MAYDQPALEGISKDEAYLIADIFSIYRDALSFAEDYFDEADELYEAIEAYVDPDSHQYKYNPVVPLVFTLEEDIVSTVVNAVFERERLYDVTPRNFATPFHMVDKDKIADQLQIVMNLQWLHPDTAFINKFTDFFKQAAHYGNTYSAMLPKFKNEDDKLIYTGPCLEPLSYYHILGDPMSTDLCAGRYIIQLEHVSKEELKRREREEGYFNISKVEDSQWIGEDRQDQLLQNLGKMSKFFATRSPGNKSNIIQLIHVHLKGHIVTLAGFRTIVRDTRKKITLSPGLSVELKPYPYDIFDEFKFYPRPMERYARGVAHIVAKYQDEISTFKRMRLENIELSLHKIIMMSLGLVDAPIEMFISAPGNIWDVDPNLVKTLEMNDVTQSSYTEQQFNILQAQDAVGSQDISRGQRTPRRQTATTDSILNQNAAKKNTTLMKRLRLWLQSIARKHIIQIHTWMDQDEYERIVGEPDAGFFSLPLSEIERLFDINVTSSSLDATRQVEQAAYIQWAQFVSRFPQIVNMPELIKDSAKMFVPYKNPDKYILPQQMPPQVAGMAQQGQVPVPGTPQPGVGQPGNVIQGNFGGQQA